MEVLPLNCACNSAVSSDRIWTDDSCLRNSSLMAIMAPNSTGVSFRARDCATAADI